MLNHNPFVELSNIIPMSFIQAFVAAMILLVVVGTLFDVVHKRSAKYFFENWRNSKKKARREIAASGVACLTIKTAISEVATSSEFCNIRRRVAHLMTMYGFILHAVATVAMTVGESAVSIWPMLWHLGAISLCLGGYWFWFFIRVDVSAEGNSPFRVVHADMFILSLLAMMSFALLWSGLQGSAWGWLFFALYIASSLVLFGGVPWSKFAHMFFKPAAALQKKLAKADGSQENLPDLGELNDPELQARYPDIPTYMGQNPKYMGLGIKRESSRHY